MARLKNILRFSLLLTIPLFFLGCAPVVPKATENASREAKQMAPPAGKALVYILRPTKFGSAVRMDINCNGRAIGATGAKQFVYVVLEPGNYVFASRAENTHELPMVIEAGQTYYLRQKVKMGWMQARTELVKMSEKEGRIELQDCTLSANVYGYSGR